MADITICPHCEKEVPIPEKNLKQFPCPECFQAVVPPPEPLTKKWIVFAVLSGILLLMIGGVVPFVSYLILEKIDKACVEQEMAFQNEKGKLEQEIYELRNRESEMNANEAKRKKEFEERKAKWSDTAGQESR